MKISTALILDCQEFPTEIKEAFFKRVRASGYYSNDCYVRWPWIDCDIWDYSERLAKSSPDQQIVEDYLMSIGIRPQTPLIIKNWW